MITKYKKYLDRVKFLEDESIKLNSQITEIEKEKNGIFDELGYKILNEVREKLSKVLTTVIADKNEYPLIKDEPYFLLNEFVGVYPIRSHWNKSIEPIIISFYESTRGKKFIKTSSYRINLYYNNDNDIQKIDNYIDNIVNRLKEIYETRKSRELKKMANKYNI